MAEPRDPSSDTDRQGVPPPAAPSEVPEVEAAPAESTVGTGTSIALGCIAGTVLLIVIGLLFLLVVMVFN